MPGLQQGCEGQSQARYVTEVQHVSISCSLSCYKHCPDFQRQREKHQPDCFTVSRTHNVFQRTELQPIFCSGTSCGSLQSLLTAFFLKGYSCLSIEEPVWGSHTPPCTSTAETKAPSQWVAPVS